MLGKYPWDPWSSWSNCFPGLVQCKRKRHCPMGAGSCIGDPMETANCVNNLCNGEDGRLLSTILRHSGIQDAEAFAETRGQNGIQGSGCKYRKLFL